MPTSKRVSRLRGIALVVILGGFAAAFLIGNLVPAAVMPVAGSTTAAKTIVFTQSPDGGTAETSFNWLLALLVAGPAAVAAVALYGAAEVTAAVRRGGRSRSSERGLELGDEV